MHRPGLTIIELIIVMAIFVIVSVSVMPMISNLEGKQLLRTTSSQILQMARKAQSRSLAGTLGQPWGLYIPPTEDNENITLFAGEEYQEEEDVPDEENQVTEKFRALGDMGICLDPAFPSGELLFPDTSLSPNTRTYIEVYPHSGADSHFIVIDTRGSIEVRETYTETCKPGA